MRPWLATSYSSKPQLVSLTLKARMVSPGGSRCKLGHADLDHEAAAGLEVRGDAAEVGDLRFLRRQVHDRVEDEVRDRDCPIHARGREVADRDADPVAARLRPQPRNHRLRQLDAVHWHADMAGTDTRIAPTAESRSAGRPTRRLRCPARVRSASASRRSTPSGTHTTCSGHTPGRSPRRRRRRQSGSRCAASARTWSRHPAQIVAFLATLDSLSNGRAALGLGIHTTEHLAWVGVDVGDYVQGTREAYEIIRTLLRGDGPAYEGDVFRLTDQATSGSRPLVPTCRSTYARSARST